MNTKRKPTKGIWGEWRGYLLAVALVALATWLKYLAQPDIIPSGVPILYFVAIVPTAIFLGLGPAVLVCILSLLAFDYFFVAPLHEFSLSHIQNAPILVIFLLVGVLFSYLASNLRRKNLIATQEISARKQSEAELVRYKEHLEDTVKHRTAELEKANLDLQNEISRCKESDEALKKSEEGLKRAQEIAHLGSWELDLLTNSLSWSDEVYRIFGLQPQEFGATYEAFLEAVHSEDRRAVGEAYSGSIREGKDSYEIEHRIIRKSTGEIRHVHEKCQHIRDENGKIIRSIGMVHDITERKKAEEALRASEKRYRSFIEVTGELGWTTNADGEVVEDIPSFRQFTGQSYEEVRGWGWSKALHPDDLENTVRVWKKAVAGKSNYETEYRLRRYDGIYRYFLARGVPALDDNGSIREWVGTCIDITERKKAEADLQQYTRELEAANRELEAFSYSVSHDLRAPLRTLDGFSHAIIDDYEDRLDETGKDYLNRIRKASQNMSQLIDDMLKLSRIVRSDMHKDRVNLSELAASIANELRTTQPDRQVEFIIAPDVMVSGDRQLLQILIRNLLENSWKYTNKCPNAIIEFRSIKQDGKQVYFIQDNGAGFNMQYADKLFQPFQRLHNTQEYPGSGIGLAIVQRVVAKHDGKIWAESEIGKGATFYFTLE